MYTVLLADDEEEAIKVIMKKIDWEALGFSVIGSADNGVKALEMVEDSQPDVLVTDIKMPYMDGMELSDRVKRRFPATKILLFTGFDEFEYAKEAIHLEVEEYILKPVNSVELTQVFRQLKIKLDQEISEKRNVEILQKHYLESLPLLQADFYSALMEGRIRGDEVDRYLADYQITFKGPLFCCLVIHTSSRQALESMDPLLLSMSVREQAKERLGERWQVKSFPYLGNTVFIAQLENENEVTELTDECDRFCKYACRMIGAYVTVGVGPVCRTVMELPQSYSGAREAVSYRALYGTSRAINMKEIVPQDMDPDMKRSGLSNEEELSSLFRTIRVGKEDEVREAVDRYLASITSQYRSMQQHHIGIMELISALYRFSLNNDIAMEDEIGNVEKMYGSLLDLEPEALKKWLLKISLFFREQMICARSRSTRSLIARAQEYVGSNYADEELSLDKICAALGVSNSYFSAMFKKETGETFVAYLTDHRMERASRLLIGTNEKSYMIARQVGYTDPNYFSYVFKRKFGVSPSKYRTEHADSGN